MTSHSKSRSAPSVAPRRGGRPRRRARPGPVSSFFSSVVGSTSRSAGLTVSTYWLAVAGPDSCSIAAQIGLPGDAPGHLGGVEPPGENTAGSALKEALETSFEAAARLTVERLRPAGDSVGRLPEPRVRGLRFRRRSRASGGIGRRAGFRFL